MLLSDISRCIREIENRVTKKELNTARLMVEPLLLDVLKAIATGQCKDYPPEDFAEEVLKVLKIRASIKEKTDEVMYKIREARVNNMVLDPTNIYNMGRILRKLPS